MEHLPMKRDGFFNPLLKAIKLEWDILIIPLHKYIEYIVLKIYILLES